MVKIFSINTICLLFQRYWIFFIELGRKQNPSLSLSLTAWRTRTISITMPIWGKGMVCYPLDNSNNGVRTDWVLDCSYFFLLAESWMLDLHGALRLKKNTSIPIWMYSNLYVRLNTFEGLKRKLITLF